MRYKNISHQKFRLGITYAATSLPPPGSLTPIAETASPVMAGSRNSFFTLSDPNLQNETSLSSKTIDHLPKIDYLANAGVDISV